MSIVQLYHFYSTIVSYTNLICLLAVITKFFDQIRVILCCRPSVVESMSIKKQEYGVDWGESTPSSFYYFYQIFSFFSKNLIDI